MTRTSVSAVVPVESIATKHEPVSEQDLADIVFNRWARIHTRNRVRRAAYDPIFVGGYIDSQSKGALAVKAWGVRDGALKFSFDDALGRSRVYAIACAHFVSLSISVLLLEDNFERSMRFDGWRFSPTVSAMDQMNKCDTPLIELRGALYAITAPEREGAPPTILSPHPLQTLTFEQLDERERRDVVRAWESRECQCQLCEYYRPRVPKYVVKRDERVKRAEKKAEIEREKAERAAEKKAKAAAKATPSAKSKAKK